MNDGSYVATYEDSATGEQILVCRTCRSISLVVMASVYTGLEIAHCANCGRRNIAGNQGVTPEQVAVEAKHEMLERADRAAFYFGKLAELIKLSAGTLSCEMGTPGPVEQDTRLEVRMTRTDAEFREWALDVCTHYNGLIQHPDGRVDLKATTELLVEEAQEICVKSVFPTLHDNLSLDSMIGPLLHAFRDIAPHLIASALGFISHPPRELTEEEKAAMAKLEKQPEVPDDAKTLTVSTGKAE